MDFEEFKSEVDERRDMGIILGLCTMPNMLCPRQRKVDTLADFRAITADRHSDIAARDQEDDHPMIREIRKRILECLHELNDKGFLEK